ncbi:hypothetical protein AB1Y20_005207 [Prymnesium parvum]|uniref:Anaphase-promoting complex subunit 1 n=1 Tax=Prymnesium parvum TaxID=97485 RepID=A0AB34J5X3_PRYPA
MWSQRELLRSREASVRHMAACEECVALFTQANTLLLYAPATDALAPIVRQLHWFREAQKGVASMDVRDGVGLLLASHDASAFLLPVAQIVRRPPCPVATRASAPHAAPPVLTLPGLTLALEASAAPHAAAAPPASHDGERARSAADPWRDAEAGELLVVHPRAEGAHADVSACALCTLPRAGGGDGLAGAALGCLDGALLLLDLEARTWLRTLHAGAPVARMWGLDGIHGFHHHHLHGSRLLLRSLQGTHTTVDLVEPFALRPLELARADPEYGRAPPGGEGGGGGAGDQGEAEAGPADVLAVSVQHTREDGQLLAFHTSAGMLHTYGPEVLSSRGSPARCVFALPPNCLPGSAVVGGHCIFCVCTSAEPSSHHVTRVHTVIPRTNDREVIVLSKVEAALPSWHSALSSSFDVGEHARRAQLQAAAASPLPLTAATSHLTHAVEVPAGVRLISSRYSFATARSSASDEPSEPMSYLLCTRSSVFELQLRRSPSRVCHRLLLRAAAAAAAAADRSPAGAAGAMRPLAIRAALLSRSFGSDAAAMVRRAAGEMCARGWGREMAALLLLAEELRLVRPEVEEAAEEGQGGVALAIAEEALARLGRRLRGEQWAPRQWRRVDPLAEERTATAAVSSAIAFLVRPLHQAMEVCLPSACLPPPAQGTHQVPQVQARLRRHPPASAAATSVSALGHVGAALPYEPPATPLARSAVALCGCLLHCSLQEHFEPHASTHAEGFDSLEVDVAIASAAAAGRASAAQDEPAWLREAEGRLKEDAGKWGDGSELRLAIEARQQRAAAHGAAAPPRDALAAARLRPVGAAEAEAMLDALMRRGVCTLAPVEIGRLLAVCGRWHQLLSSLPHALALRLLYSEAAAACGSHVERTLNLVALRAHLAPVAPPWGASAWARLLGAVGPDGGGAGCEGGRMLLRLSLLQASKLLLGGQSVAEAAAQLQVFMHHWLALGWPLSALVAELKVALEYAAPVLCWMLEHRAELLAELELEPRLLLGAIAYVLPAASAPCELPVPAVKVISNLSHQWKASRFVAHGSSRRACAEL